MPQMRPFSDGVARSTERARPKSINRILERSPGLPSMRFSSFTSLRFDNEQFRAVRTPLVSLLALGRVAPAKTARRLRCGACPGGGRRAPVDDVHGVDVLETLEDLLGRRAGAKGRKEGEVRRARLP